MYGKGIVLRVADNELLDLPQRLRSIPIDEVRRRQRLGMEAFAPFSSSAASDQTNLSACRGSTSSTIMLVSSMTVLNLNNVSCPSHFF